MSNTTTQLAKEIVAKGESTSSDSNSRVFDLSELTLVIENRDGKAVPVVLSFSLWGLDLTKSLTTGEVQIIDDDDSDGVEAFALEDDAFNSAVDAFLDLRLKAVQDLGL